VFFPASSSPPRLLDALCRVGHQNN
jgi:hypothetical protein